MSARTKVNHVILIIIDDIRAEHLFALLDSGRLPNMATLAKNGISCRNCITSFPSITYPCYSNIVVGSYSGYYPKEGSGIPCYHFVARSDPPSKGDKLPIIRFYGSGRHLKELNNDLGNNVQTIFEQAGEGNFLSSLNIVYRGSEIVVPNDFKSKTIFKNAEEAYATPRKYFANNEAPKVSIIYIPKTDELMHNKGFDHPDYITEIVECDKYIGSFINVLREKGYYKDCVICIVSDHGNYKSEKIYDLEPFFAKKKLIPYVPKKKVGDFDANMGSVGFFNFPGDNWHQHPTITQLEKFKTISNNTTNVFEMLWEIPGTRFMYYRDDNNTPDRGIIYLKRKDPKTGEILQGKIEYEDHGKSQKTKYVYDKEDLFEYFKNESAIKLLDNKSHYIDDWLAGTYMIDFPMLVDQLPRYFKNPRSCDVIISTCARYSFAYEHGKTVNPHLYNHDIALKMSMTVPLIIGGSEEIPNLEIPYCKTTDVVPTLLDFLGKKPHKSVVGKSLLT